MVAAWPRRAELAQVLLAGPVPRAVWALMSRCGLAVPGHLARRASSQARSSRAVRSSRGRGLAAQEQAAAARVGVAQEHGADGAAAGRVNAGQGHDEPGCRGGGSGDGVVDVVLAQRLQHGGGGPRPTLMPRAGLRKITPADRQNPNSERRATRVLWRCDPCRPRTWSWMSSRVTSRRW